MLFPFSRRTVCLISRNSTYVSLSTLNSTEQSFSQGVMSELIPLRGCFVEVPGAVEMSSSGKVSDPVMTMFIDHVWKPGHNVTLVPEPAIGVPIDDSGLWYNGCIGSIQSNK